jgi:hypothetical protein
MARLGRVQEGRDQLNELAGSLQQHRMMPSALSAFDIPETELMSAKAAMPAEAPA